MKKFSMGGILLVVLGLFMLMWTSGLLPIHVMPRYWPLILIITGIYLFYRHNWKINPGSVILTLLGIFFLSGGFRLLNAAIYWPVILIAVGAYFIIKRLR